MLVGYARVSTTEQSLEVQLDQLAQAGVEKVFSEQRSGKRAANRPELQRALDFCREGDTFVVTRLDRFARSAADLHRTDPPSFQWTPMLAFRSWRGVSDEREASGLSGDLQTRSG